MGASLGRGGNRQRSPPGSPPGVLSVDPGAVPSRVRIIAYDEGTLLEEAEVDVSRVEELRDSDGVLWVDVVGLGDAGRLSALGEAFGLHPLLMEDVVHVDQRPKAEEYEGQLFVVVRMTSPGGASQQLALVLTHDVLLTFQERDGDAFGPVRGRLQRGGNRIRRSGADYLAYALLDALIDAYGPEVDVIVERLEEFEDALLTAPGRQAGAIAELHELRRALQGMRRDVAPLQDVLAGLSRADPELFQKETHLFLRDCKDHVTSLRDELDGARELVGSLMDMQASLAGQRMNEIMKVLTIIATIFIPLSFIAGVFGMNFDPEVSPWNMPELGLPWGYPAALLLMGTVAYAMVVFFRRRGWLGPESHR